VSILHFFAHVHQTELVAFCEQSGLWRRQLGVKIMKLKAGRVITQQFDLRAFGFVLRELVMLGLTGGAL
jgi:hypothetical protein